MLLIITRLASSTLTISTADENRSVYHSEACDMPGDKLYVVVLLDCPNSQSKNKNVTI